MNYSKKKKKKYSQELRGMFFEGGLAENSSPGASQISLVDLVEEVREHSGYKGIL